MLRKRISLDSDSDPASILAQLRNDCAASGLNTQQIDAVVSEVREPLETLIQSGRAVANSSGQFRASREILTESATVTLDAQFGVRPGLFTRLKKALTRGG